MGMGSPSVGRVQLWVGVVGEDPWPWVYWCTGVLYVEGWWERVSLCPLPSDWWSHVGMASDEPGMGF